MQPVIIQDLFIFRNLARLANSFARRRLGTNAELIVDEFAEKLLEELDYNQEARNIEVAPWWSGRGWALSAASSRASLWGSYWVVGAEKLLEVLDASQEGHTVEVASHAASLGVPVGATCTWQLCSSGSKLVEKLLKTSDNRTIKAASLGRLSDAPFTAGQNSLGARIVTGQ